MSVSFTATLMAGYRVSDLCRYEDRISTVTRYHEETGQPYQKEVTTRVFLVLGKEQPAPVESTPSEWPDILPGSWRGRVGVEGTASCELPDYVWGVRLLDHSSRDDVNSITSINPQAIKEALDEARALLDRLATKFSVVAPADLKPQLYLVRYCG